MILGLDTSSSLCRLWLQNDDGAKAYEWEAGRTLADGLIAFLRQRLISEGVSWSDLSGIAVYRGPGSFTGLRIGLTVLNTLADTETIPIVGATGDDWLKEAVARLKNGENDKLVMPLYGTAPNITQPRK